MSWWLGWRWEMIDPPCLWCIIWLESSGDSQLPVLSLVALGAGTHSVSNVVREIVRIIGQVIGQVIAQIIDWIEVKLSLAYKSDF